MLSGPVLFLLLVLAIAFVVVATTRFKLHPFLALLLAGYGMGLASGVSPAQTITALTGGFGRTIGYIGIVIACGCIIGIVLEKSGAALVMANTVVGWIGRTRSVLAMSCTGAIVSIPVFCDSGYVILSPLARSLARRTRESMAAFAVALSMGLYATHCLVPPTPGPIAAAGEMRADIGTVILFGIVVSVPVIVATYAYARYIGRRVVIETGPATAADDEGSSSEPAPRRLQAFVPIVVPVLLIALKSVADLPGRPFGEGPFVGAVRLLGDPNAALLIGGGLAAWVARRHGLGTFSGWCSEGLRDAGTIILITGAGGALGAVLRETPLATLVGEALGSMRLGRFSLFLPFIVAAGLKTSIGSSTVAMITTASLVAPLLPTMGLATGAGPALATLAVASGAMMVSHVNDSYFWVITQMSKLTVAQGYRLVTVASGIAGLTAILMVFLLGLIVL